MLFHPMSWSIWHNSSAPLSLTCSWCWEVFGVYMFVDTSQVRVANFITLEVNHSNSDTGGGGRAGTCNYFDFRTNLHCFASARQLGLNNLENEFQGPSIFVRWSQQLTHVFCNWLPISGRILSASNNINFHLHWSEGSPVCRNKWGQRGEEKDKGENVWGKTI